MHLFDGLLSIYSTDLSSIAISSPVNCDRHYRTPPTISLLMIKPHYCQVQLGASILFVVCRDKHSTGSISSQFISAALQASAPTFFCPSLQWLVPIPCLRNNSIVYLSLSSEVQFLVIFGLLTIDSMMHKHQLFNDTCPNTQAATKILQTHVRQSMYFKGYRQVVYYSMPPQTLLIIYTSDSCSLLSSLIDIESLIL